MGPPCAALLTHLAEQLAWAWVTLLYQLFCAAGAAAGDELPVITAPRGLSLREAISRAVTLPREAISGGVSPPWLAAASQATTPRGSSAAVTPRAAALWPSPATLQSSAPSVSGSATLAHLQQQQQQAGRSSMAMARIGELPLPSGAPEGAASRRSAAAVLSPVLPQQQMEDGAAEPLSIQVAAAAAAAAAEAPPTGSWDQSASVLHPKADGQQHVESPLQQAQTTMAGTLPESPGFRRFWSHDGSPPDGKHSVEVTWQAMSAVRMWPMLAPFVPRMLREDICSAHPRFGVPAAPLEPAAETPGGTLPRAAAAVAAGPHVLSRGVRPCIQRQEAAVMIADVTGFTALTETLSKRGPAGVELLTRCMNRYFTQVRGTGKRQGAPAQIELWAAPPAWN